MEENNNVVTTPVVEQKPRKTGLGVLIALLILLVLGFGVYICYDKFIANAPETNNKGNEENKKNDTSNIVSKESIIELSEKKSKYINTNFEDRIVMTDETMWYKVAIDLVLEDGKLYLQAGNNKSIIANFKETAVQIIDSPFSCDDTPYEYVLTSSGNLYLIELNIDSNGNIDKDMLNKLDNSKPLEVKLSQVNPDDIKVLALTDTKISNSLEGWTSSCGYADAIAYTSDNTYRSIRKFNDVYDKLVILTFGGYESDAIFIYEDNTASLNGKTIIKNKDNADLVIKRAFDFQDEKVNYLVDENDYLYVNKDGKVTLYIDSKIKTFTIVDPESTMADKDIKIEFENGKVLNIKGYVRYERAD